MRQIKFRAQDIASNKWLYGDLRHHKDDVCIFEQGGNKGEQVKRDTIGQFVGLKDKNGKEIYEGDILRLTIPDGSTREFVVKFGKTERNTKPLDDFEEEPSYPIVIVGWLFEWEGYDLVPSNTDGTPDYEKMEIVGNIYDNGE